jgi:hypothetical protein
MQHIQGISRNQLQMGSLKDEKSRDEIESLHLYPKVKENVQKNH